MTLTRRYLLDRYPSDSVIALIDDAHNKVERWATEEGLWLRITYVDPRQALLLDILVGDYNAVFEN